MRALATLAVVGLLAVGCDGRDGDRASRSASPSSTATVLGSVEERDGRRDQPAAGVPYGTLRGVRAEGDLP
jgi:hypothetical protein